MVENRNSMGVVDRLLLLDREEDVSMNRSDVWDLILLVVCVLDLVLAQMRVEVAERRAKDAEQWAEVVAVEAQMWMEKR